MNINSFIQIDLTCLLWYIIYLALVVCFMISCFLYFSFHFFVLTSFCSVYYKPFMFRVYLQLCPLDCTCFVFGFPIFSKHSKTFLSNPFLLPHFSYLNSLSVFFTNSCMLFFSLINISIMLIYFNLPSYYLFQVNI